MKEPRENPIIITSLVFMASLVAMLILTGLWLWNGQLEESITAHGQMVPDGQLRRVMASSSGIIVNLQVRENQVVKAGEILLELDPDSAQIEQSSILTQLQQAQDEAKVLRNAFSGSGGPPSGSSFGRIQNAWLSASRQTLQAELASSQMEISRVQHEYQETISRKNNLSEQLRNNETLLKQHQALYASGGLSSNELMEFEQKITAQRGELASLEEQVQGREMALAQAKHKPAIYQGNYQQNVLDRLSELEQRIVTLDRDLQKTRLARKRTQITAPIDGIVHEVAIRGNHEVVNTGDVLVSLVPKEAPLVAEVQVPNQDLAYIHLDQEAALRLDAFPYQQFGRLSGRVISISPSTKQDDKGQPFYLVRIKPEKDTLGHEMPVISGMTLSADLITRHKNLLSFFTEPLTHHLNQALKDPSSR